MIMRIVAVFLLVLSLGFGSGFANDSVYAKSAQEECDDVKAAIPEISCKVCGDCAVVTTRTSEKICKQCNDIQCDKVECSECSDSECATK